MKYVAMFVMVIFLVLVLHTIPKAAWVALGAYLRPVLPVILLSALAVFAAALIAYFGGHIRVL